MAPQASLWATWISPDGTTPSSSTSTALMAQARWSKTLSIDVLRAVSAVTDNKIAVTVSLIKSLPVNSEVVQTYGEVDFSFDCGSTSASGGGATSLFDPSWGPGGKQMFVITNQQFTFQEFVHEWRVVMTR